MGMTPQHFHTISTSCAIQVANYAHHKTLYIHVAYSYALNEQGTQHCSLHSLPSIHITMFSSNKISQHNLNFNKSYRPYTIHTIQTQHWSWIPHFLHTGKTDHICHAQYSKYIVHCSHPQHNPLPMHINMHSQHYPPHCLPQPSAHN